MDLEELKKRLYKPGATFEERPETPEVFEPGRKQEYPKVGKEWSTLPKLKKWQLSSQQKKFFSRTFILLTIIIVIVAGFMFWRGLVFFDKNKVVLKIYGPERIISGEEITYIVQYKNNAKVALENIQLSLEFPEGAVWQNSQADTLVQTVSLGKILPQAEDRKEFKVQIMGLKDSQKKIIARLNYQPANIKSFFENKTEFQSIIISVPLVLNFDLPERLVNGQIVNLTIRYLNTSDAVFSDLKLKMEYPAGFNFISAYPRPDEDKNIWLFSQISAKEEGKIVISGSLAGQRDEIKSFQAQLGITKNETFIPLAESLNSSQILVPPLNISQIINNSENYIANAGDTLHYKIKYENTADVEISSVIIGSKLEGDVFDFASLNIKKGFFNSLTNTIIWNTASLPQLALLSSHSEGEVEFSIKIKDKLPINNFNDKNFIVTNTVKIDSLNVPLPLMGTQLSGESKLITKLNSRLILNVRGYFKDTLIPNFGPLPPKVSQMTTYTLYWQIINTSNDLENVRVEAYLPSYIHWVNRFEPENAEIKYEPNTGKITWNIGKLPAAIGILSPVKYAAFQVGLIPAANQIGSIVNLIGNSTITGRDTFTNVNLTVTEKSLRSDLPDDPTVGWENSRVSE